VLNARAATEAIKCLPAAPEIIELSFFTFMTAKATWFFRFLWQQHTRHCWLHGLALLPSLVQMPQWITATTLERLCWSKAMRNIKGRTGEREMDLVCGCSNRMQHLQWVSSQCCNGVRRSLIFNKVDRKIHFSNPLVHRRFKFKTKDNSDNHRRFVHATSQFLYETLSPTLWFV
jgi:hypothetical protein